MDMFEHIADCNTPITEERKQELRDLLEKALDNMSMNNYYHIRYELCELLGEYN